MMKLTTEEFSDLKILVQAGQLLIDESDRCNTLYVFEELAGYSMERADYLDHAIIARIAAVQLKANLIVAVLRMQSVIAANPSKQK